MEKKNLTPEQITRFIEIRATLEKYNKETILRSATVPNISIDERMQCEYYFNSLQYDERQQVNPEK